MKTKYQELRQAYKQLLADNQKLMADSETQKCSWIV